MNGREGRVVFEFSVHCCYCALERTKKSTLALSLFLLLLVLLLLLGLLHGFSCVLVPEVRRPYTLFRNILIIDIRGYALLKMRQSIFPVDGAAIKINYEASSRYIGTIVYTTRKYVLFPLTC